MALSTLRQSTGMFARKSGFRAASLYAPTMHFGNKQNIRFFSNFSGKDGKIKAAPMVYISGEEMTKYACDLMMEKWVSPRIDTSAWQYFDLSCKSRDSTKDQVLRDAVAAGADLGAIFKEPTITPTEVQKKAMGLSQSWPSPNGAMRRGWNGITISRDTIHIKGIELGFKRPVLFERHAVGGEYSAHWDTCADGRMECNFYPNEATAGQSFEKKQKIASFDLTDKHNVAVVYHNPLDNVEDLAHYFFKRCLEAKVVPYVVTKKTVFKWQEGFWAIHKDVFDKHYKQQYLEAGLLDGCGKELQHLISDAATMQIIRWTGGGFGMSAHNYDGDMLTDEVAQVHRSPGFITSNLIGRKEDGTLIKEFEASHGTVADLWHMHLEGKETSLNPLGLAEALMGAMNHSAMLNDPNSADSKAIFEFTSKLREVMHAAMVAGKGTRDLCGPSGLTTEQFFDVVADGLDGKAIEAAPSADKVKYVGADNVDTDAVDGMFAEFDKDSDGTIDKQEFCEMLMKLGVAPMKASGKKKAM